MRILGALCVLLLAFNIFGVGCEKAGSGGDSVGASSSAVGLDAFQSSLYSFAQSQNCVQCHSSANNPYFAAPSVSQAYAAANNTNYISFTSPASSQYVIYATNNHCGIPSICGPNTQTSAAVTAAVESWANAELAAENSGSSGSQQLNAFMTASQMIPATVPTLMQVPTVVRFPLSSLSPAVSGANGAIIEIEIQLVDSGEYRINNFKVVGNSVKLGFTGVYVYLNTSASTGPGAEDTSQGVSWNRIFFTVPVTGLPNPLPAGPIPSSQASFMITNAEELQLPANSTSNKLTLGFDNVVIVSP